MSEKYVFFDLDGTLTDPGEGLSNSVAYAIDKMGDKVPTKDVLYTFIGPPLIEQFQSTMGYSYEQSKQAVKYFREYFTEKGMMENKVYEGIEEALKALRDDGYKLVVATSKPEPFAIKILNHFGLSKYFDLIAGSTLDETRTKKHDVIAYAFDILGISKEESQNVIMVGDRKHDVFGSHEAGIRCIGVLYGYGDMEEHLMAGADFICPEISNLREIVNKSLQ